MSSTGLIDKLCEGYSNQAKAANQFWLILTTASVIALIGKAKPENDVDLPFTLGKVNLSDFYSINFIIISLLIIAFTSAMIQVIRTRKLIQMEIDNMESEFLGVIHVQDYVDSVTTSTYNRVAPISQFLLGKKQFQGQSKEVSVWRVAGIILYASLKLMTFVFMYVLPVLAISKCYFGINSGADECLIRLPKIMLLVILFLVLVSMSILIWGDVKWLIELVKRLLKPNLVRRAQLLKT